MKRGYLLCIGFLLTGCGRGETASELERGTGDFSPPHSVAAQRPSKEPAGVARDDFERERSSATTSLKDRMENKAPPSLQVQGWMNTGGQELQLAALRGNVVVLDFWGVW